MVKQCSGRSFKSQLCKGYHTSKSNGQLDGSLDDDANCLPFDLKSENKSVGSRKQFFSLIEFASCFVLNSFLNEP